MENIVEERQKYENIEHIFVRESKKFMDSLGFVAEIDRGSKPKGGRTPSPDKGRRQDPNIMQLMNQVSNILQYLDD
jgi:hypothetical protein